MKAFFVYAILLAVLVSFSLLYLKVFHSKIGYLSILKIYVIIEYSIFSIFLYNLYENTKAKKIIFYSIFPFLIFATINFLNTDKSSFDNKPSIIEFLAFIIFIIYFFYEKMKTVFMYPLYQSISFWICVGLFLYFTGNFFFFLFTNYSNDKVFLNQMRIIYSLVTITKNVILSLALFANEPQELIEEELQIPKDLQLDEFTLNPTKP